MDTATVRTGGRGLLSSLYGSPLALLTDLYQLTMAQGYWKTGMAGREAVFQLYFRRNPFGGGWALAAGLETALEYLDGLRFGEDDLAYLAALPAAGGGPLFERGFLAWLGELRLSCDVDAAPEGTVVFAPEPLLRVRGPLAQGQLLETALLNILNFQTMVATKAARVTRAAAGAEVLEFGLRRAQGIDGAVSASRAAHIGGCAATSNVLAGKLLGIPVRGTHAHSWVMAFGDEREAFQAYAEALPGDCSFLVDTYDTLEGVRHAIEAGRWLRSRGRRLLGVRLDSGDLAALSLQARRLLDEAGFADAFIAASDDLDESRIADLVEAGAPIAVWGVGTRLVTGGGQGALGGVYKLSALRKPDGSWRRTLKVSSQLEKSSFPGALQVRRSFKAGLPCGDTIYDTLETQGPPAGAGLPHEDLLVPVLREGRRVAAGPELAAVRQKALSSLAALPPGPLPYPVELAPGLRETRQELIGRLGTPYSIPEISIEPPVRTRCRRPLATQ